MIQHTTHSITLSRLHKLIERVKACIADQHKVMTSTLISAMVTTPLKAEIATFREKAKSGMEAREKAEQLSRDLAHLRGVVAAENARLGINELLGLQEVLGKHLAVVKAAVASGEETSLKMDDLVDGYGDVVPGIGLGDYGRQVSPLGDAQLKELKAKADQLQAEIYSLSDQIADRNATKIQISVSADVSKYLA